MNGCNLRNDTNDDDRPRFAVIRLKPESNLLGLFQLLLCNGFGEVAFVKNLNDANFGGNKDAVSSQPFADESVQENVISSGNTKRPVDPAKRPPNLESTEKRSSDTNQRLPERGSADGGDKSLSIQQQSLVMQQQGPDKRAGVRMLDYGSITHERLSAITKSMSAEVSASPQLPLSTFTCPLPLPVDRANAAGLNAAQASKKVAIPRITPPSTSKPSSSSTTTTSVKENASMSRGKNSKELTSTQPIAQRAAAKEIPQEVFVSCHLCNSKIMATRFSNLTNHVRRHAPVKQFQCCYCDYAHNEIAKVRLHMANNHGDKKSRPINNINAEMQDTWRRLMRECFPERSKRQRQPQQRKPSQGPPQPTATAIISHGTHIASSAAKKREGDVDRKAIVEPSDMSNLFSTSGDGYPLNADSEDDVEGQRFARCDQCYTYVNVNMKESHVRTCHLENLPSSSFVCSVCGLESIEREEVETHILHEHDDNPEARVINADLAAYVDQMIDEYFPLHALEYTTTFHSNIFDQLKTSSVSLGLNAEHDDKLIIFSGNVIENGADQDRFDVDHYQKSTKRKCRVCHHFVGSTSCGKHARRHIEMSAVYFECPICANYRSNVGARVQRHLVDKHGAIDCEAIPTVLRHEWIPVVGFGNAVAQAMKRCFGVSGFVRKKKYAWRKRFHIGRIQKNGRSL